MFDEIEKKSAQAMRSPGKGFLIGHLTAGDTVVGQAAVVRRELRETRAGKPYLSLLLSDRTGQIDAKDWDHAAENEDVFEPGTIVKIKAVVEEFNGALQLKIEKARLLRDGEYDLGDFIAVSDYDVDQMYAALACVVAGVRDAWIRRLLETILERYRAEWLRAPAAIRIHHAFSGGLLEHVLSMCRAALALCTHYTRLDRDVLIAGCILHDVGKMRELELGVSVTATAAGKLVGHIGEGLIMLEDCCRAIDGFPEQTRMLLRHMIASHHGSMEYGALKLPMTPEAIALSALDDLDFKLECAFRLIDEGDEDFSSWHRPLEREIYRVRREPSASADPGPDAAAE